MRDYNELVTNNHISQINNELHSEWDLAERERERDFFMISSELMPHQAREALLSASTVMGNFSRNKKNVVKTKR